MLKDMIENNLKELEKKEKSGDDKMDLNFNDEFKAEVIKNNEGNKNE